MSKADAVRFENIIMGRDPEIVWEQNTDGDFTIALPKTPIGNAVSEYLSEVAGNLMAAGVEEAPHNYVLNFGGDKKVITISEHTLGAIREILSGRGR